jgi:hypothetical protein
LAHWPAENSFSGVVATFSDSDTVTAAGDFAATIDWGDGTTSAGTVTLRSASERHRKDRRHRRQRHQAAATLLRNCSPYGTAL